jgi:hypothetical protein
MPSKVHLDVQLPERGPARVAVIVSLVLGAAVALLLPAILGVFIVETLKTR